MNKSITNKILLARRLADMAQTNLRSSNDLALGIGINLLQDSVEAFLLGVAEHVNAEVKANTSFDQYFVLINAKIAPKELAFKSRLLALNKLRVNMKHYGLAPAKSETEGLLVTVREFYEETAKNVLGASLATITLISLLREGDSKELMKEAEAFFLKGEYANCLISCRKALYSRFEWQYDVSPYADEKAPAWIFSRAPFFARSKKYIEDNVREPTDFIVLDHSEFEIEILKNNMDGESFWNVWRLTPDVYRIPKTKEWVVKRDFEKLDEDGIKDRAEYVLDATIGLLLSADQRILSAKTPDRSRQYYVDVKMENVPVYKKADKTSEVLCTLPAGTNRVFVDYEVPGLKGDGTYWHAFHRDTEPPIFGFISGDDVA